jgi:hypothetical protein
MQSSALLCRVAQQLLAVFFGYARGENIGWIKFNGTADDSTVYKVATTGPLAVTLASFWYWLEDLDLNGATTLHGPVSATVQTPTAVTLAGFEAAAGGAASFAGLAMAAGLAAAGGLLWRRRRQEPVKS